MGKIKVVIFDFDHTLYKDVVFDSWKEYCKNAMRELLSFLPANQVEEIVEQQTEFGELSIMKTLQIYNVPSEVWKTYRNTNLRNFDISKSRVVSNKTLQDFANKYSLYIVTNNIKVDVVRVCKATGINFNLFKEIVSNDYKNNELSKKRLYEYVCKKEQIKPSELFVIGDIFETDIQPAIEIGANGKVVEDVNFTLKDFDL